MKHKLTFWLPENRYEKLLELACFKGLSLDKLVLELCDNAIADFRTDHRMAAEHYTQRHGLEIIHE